MKLSDLSPGDRFRLSRIPERTGRVVMQGQGGTAVVYDPISRDGLAIAAEMVRISSGTEVDYLPESRKVVVS